MYNLDEVGNIFKTATDEVVLRGDNPDYADYLLYIQENNTPDFLPPTSISFQEAISWLSTQSLDIYNQTLSTGFALNGFDPMFSIEDFLDLGQESLSLYDTQYKVAKTRISSSNTATIKLITKAGVSYQVSPTLLVTILDSLYILWMNLSTEFKTTAAVAENIYTPTTITQFYLTENLGPNRLASIKVKANVVNGNFQPVLSLAADEVQVSQELGFRGFVELKNVVPTGYQVYTAPDGIDQYVPLNGKVSYIKDSVTNQNIAAVVIGYGSTRLEVYPLNDGQGEITVTVPCVEPFVPPTPPNTIPNPFGIRVQYNSTGEGLDEVISDPINGFIYIVPTSPGALTGAVDLASIYGAEGLTGISHVGSIELVGTMFVDVYPVTGDPIVLGQLIFTEGSLLVQYLSLEPSVAGPFTTSSSIEVTPIIG